MTFAGDLLLGDISWFASYLTFDYADRAIDCDQSRQLDRGRGHDHAHAHAQLQLQGSGSAAQLRREFSSANSNDRITRMYTLTCLYAAASPGGDILQMISALGSASPVAAAGKQPPDNESAPAAQGLTSDVPRVRSAAPPPTAVPDPEQAADQKPLPEPVAPRRGRPRHMYNVSDRQIDRPRPRRRSITKGRRRRAGKRKSARSSAGAAAKRRAQARARGARGDAATDADAWEPRPVKRKRGDSQVRLQRNILMMSAI